MKRNHCQYLFLFAALSFCVLIMDSKTALAGATEGVKLCLYTVLPSLFPLFVLSSIINGNFPDSQSPILRRICQLCSIPPGAGSILITGILSGYPVGAQAINEAYKNKHIDITTARRMLGFCSNSGPSFIFGMISSLFETKLCVWTLWMIHIASAIFVGTVLPKAGTPQYLQPAKSEVSVSQAVEKSKNSILSVCAWILLFRVIIAYLEKYILICCSKEISTMAIGALEISNGIHYLNRINSPGMRYVLSSVFLGFGGLCVSLQTISVTSDTGIGSYFPGKVIQTAVSFLMAAFMQLFLFPQQQRWEISPVLYLITLLLCISLTVLLFRQKNSSNLSQNVI